MQRHDAGICSDGDRVSTRRQQNLGNTGMALAAGDVERRVSADSRSDIHVTAGINQRFGKFLVTALCSRVQGRHPVTLCFVDIRTLAQKLPYGIDVASCSGVNNRPDGAIGPAEDETK